jgi:hypothetical protein
MSGEEPVFQRKYENKKLLSLQALRFLDYQQPPRDLTPLVSAVDQSREEVIKRRGSNNHQQRQQPLLFFLSNSLWESGHNWARSAWFIPTNEGPEGKMVSMMHEVLARIFEGGPIPWVLFNKFICQNILNVLLN